MSHVENIETVWNYLKTKNIHELDMQHQPSEKYGWLSVFCSLLHPPPDLLTPSLIEDKNLLIHLSNCSFIHEDVVHIQMLNTLFYKITGLNSPAVLGTHWEIIGFQGLDPATDFRGVGMLGLLQPLIASLSTDSLPFIINVVNLSHSPCHGFPFMVLSLNVTNIILKALKEGLLDRFINKKQDVLIAVNICYLAVLYFIYDAWMKEKLTLSDCAQVLKKAETLCKKDLSLTISRYDKYLADLDTKKTSAIQLDEVQFQMKAHG